MSCHVKLPNTIGLKNMQRIRQEPSFTGHKNCHLTCKASTRPARDLWSDGSVAEGTSHPLLLPAKTQGKHLCSLLSRQSVATDWQLQKGKKDWQGHKNKESKKDCCNQQNHYGRKQRKQANAAGFGPLFPTLLPQFLAPFVKFKGILIWNTRDPQ